VYTITLSPVGDAVACGPEESVLAVQRGQVSENGFMSPMITGPAVEFSIGMTP
jgi:hypothetical protein